MSNDQNNISNSNPFFEFHHDHDHQGFAFPIVTDQYNPFMYNLPQQHHQNPSEFHFQGYNTLDAPPSPCNSFRLTPNSSASISSQEAGVEEDSSKSKKEVEMRACEEGDAKSKNIVYVFL